MRLLPFLTLISKVLHQTKWLLLCIASLILFLVQCGKTDDANVREDSMESNSPTTLLAIDLKRIDLHLFETPGYYLKDTLLITGGKFEGDYSRFESEYGDLRYKVLSIQADPGEVLLVTISASSSEKDMKVHNWVLLDKNLNKEKVKGLLTGMNDDQISRKSILNEYIIEISDDIMYGEMVSVNFEAPMTEGRYIYLCTHSEHFELGEYGYLIIE